MSDEESTGNPAFIQAANDVKSLTSKPSDSDLLTLYGLFKQGVVGDNTTPKPGMFDFKGKAKWEAWNNNKGISKEDAQTKYVEFVSTLKK